MYKPNVIIIVMDSQRVDNLSCYGYSLKTSPNIDRVAEEGVVFLNNFTPCAWTPPAHASIMTGRYYSGHQLICLGPMRSVMPSGIPTIAEVLDSLGYDTASFSNNHLLTPDEDGILRGFIECRYPAFEGLRSPRNRIQDIQRRFFECIEDFEEGIDKGAANAIRVIMEWLDRRVAKEIPFFIFVNCTEPHHPYWPPQPFRRRFLLPGVDDYKARRVPQMSADGRWIPRYPKSPEEWYILKSLLDGETAALDHQLGILFNHLRELGVYDDTLIFITSDHGDVLWEHSIKYSSHKSLYDANLHVPLIVKGPREHIPAGKRVANLTQLVDIFPTILDVLGINDRKIRRSIQGYSLLLALEKEPVRKYALAEAQNPSIWPSATGPITVVWSKAIRNQEYKYIWHSDGREELYNVAEDPTEQNNIINEEKGKAEALRGELERILLSLDIPEIPINRHIYNRMIAWGYQRKIIPA